MTITRDLIKQIISRFIVIGVSIFSIGFILHGSYLFRNTGNQFLIIGVSAALFYTFKKAKSLRSAISAAFIWYIAISIIYLDDGWVFILNMVCITGISAAVYFYLLMIRLTFFKGMLRRIAILMILFGIINVIILLVLNELQNIIAPPFFRVGLYPMIRNNFEIGIIAGLTVGIGIEIAEFILSRISFREFIKGAL